MSKSKEEILVNHGEAWEYSNTLKVCPLSCAHDAMDEYAKQQVISFDTWRVNNKWIECNNKEYEVVYNGYNTMLEPVSYTTGELYALFLEHQKQ